MEARSINLVGNQGADLQVSNEEIDLQVALLVVGLKEDL